jgi:hypothetical protein
MTQTMYAHVHSEQQQQQKAISIINSTEDCKGKKKKKM